MGLVNIIVWGSIFVWWVILYRKYLGLETAWVRFRERVKAACDSSERCKDVRAYIIKNPNISFSYALFGLLCIVFVPLFFVWVYPFIKMLYIDIKTQIDGVTIGSPAFRNVSLSIAGSITLSIAVLGLILTVIRNLLTRQQNRTDEQRLVTEQISRAIEQIGAYKQSADGKNLEPNIEVRMGGLYSLQRIMYDSPRDALSIVKILYAYVRENLKRDKDKRDKLKEYNKQNFSRPEEKPLPLPEDIVSALNIISQFNKDRKKKFGIDASEVQSDFTYADFTNYSIRNIDFSYISFYHADFSGSNLVAVIFSNAILFSVNFSDTQLSVVNFSNARFLYGKFCEVSLGSGNFSGADLSGLNLSGADLTNASNLTQKQVNQAVGDIHTRLPTGLKMRVMLIDGQLHTMYEDDED